MWRETLILVCTCICTCIVIDINNINQPHLFEQPQEKCKHGEGYVILHCSTCIDWLHVCQYDGIFIQLFKVAMFIKMDGMQCRQSSLLQMRKRELY